jgi:hypothetical protein
MHVRDPVDQKMYSLVEDYSEIYEGKATRRQATRRQATWRQATWRLHFLNKCPETIK